jgi:hypothetical protein
MTIINSLTLKAPYFFTHRVTNSGPRLLDVFSPAVLVWRAANNCLLCLGVRPVHIELHTELGVEKSRERGGIGADSSHQMTCRALSRPRRGWRRPDEAAAALLPPDRCGCNGRWNLEKRWIRRGGLRADGSDLMRGRRTPDEVTAALPPPDGCGFKPSTTDWI